MLSQEDTELLVWVFLGQGSTGSEEAVRVWVTEACPEVQPFATGTVFLLFLIKRRRLGRVTAS